MPEQNKTHCINDLVKIMETLLGSGGCPWDREQTPQSLAPFAIEEAFELAEALEEGDANAIKEELGDLLLQVIFHCELAQKARLFTLEDVIKTVCAKLIRRHPHVFGQKGDPLTSEDVLKNWNKIKESEKSKKKGFGIPVPLPALQRAQKIGGKTKDLKFDWTNAQDVLLKLDEEIDELKEAIAQKKKNHVEEELGDVFFVLSQLARHLKLEAETAARKANQKFEKRFMRMLELTEEKNIKFSELDPTEKEALWEQVKNETKTN